MPAFPYQQQIGMVLLVLGGILYLWQNRSNVASGVAWAWSLVPKFGSGGTSVQAVTTDDPRQAFDVLWKEFKGNPEARKTLAALWPHFLDDGAGN